LVSGKLGPLPVGGLAVNKQVNEFAAGVSPLGKKCLLAQFSVSNLKDL
jgi:hypothetical protein